MYAAYVGHDTIVNLLLDSDANPSLGTPSNLTPLMVAAGCGNESVCYFLIQVRERERKRERERQRERERESERVRECAH